jgi:hypothetical protein
MIFNAWIDPVSPGRVIGLPALALLANATFPVC